MIKNIVNWLRVDDLDIALKHTVEEVVMRFSRRNVSVQSWDVCDEEEFEQLLDDGNSAMEYLSRMQSQLDHGNRHAIP
jgi:hypothetical protein